MNILGYIEFKAQTLTGELANQWNREQALELSGVLEDLKTALNPGKSIAHEPLDKPKQVSAPKQVKVRTPRQDRKTIINLILDTIFEQSKTGKTEFNFYAKDFGVSEEYLKKGIFWSLNSDPIKTRRFPDLKISSHCFPGGMRCHIERKQKNDH